MQGNKLSLNVLKRQALIAGSQPKIKKITDKSVDHPQCFIGDSQVENVDRTEYLGVMIDWSLNWEEHINTVRAIVSRAIEFFYIHIKNYNTCYIYVLLYFLITLQQYNTTGTGPQGAKDNDYSVAINIKTCKKNRL